MTRTVAVVLSTLIVLSMVTATAAVALPGSTGETVTPSTGTGTAADGAGVEEPSGADPAAIAGAPPPGLSPGAVPRQVDDTDQADEEQPNETSGDRPITESDPDRTGDTDAVSELTYEIPLPEGGTFTPEPGLDPALNDTERERVYALLQFARRPTDEEAGMLGERGYEQVRGLTESTRYVRLPVDRLAEIAEMEAVRAVTRVRPEWRIDPEFSERIAEREEPVPVTILTFEPLADETVERLELDRIGPDSYYGELAPESVRALQRNQRVYWMDATARNRPTVAEGRRMVGAPMVASPLSGTGYTGAGVDVGVIDTGIQHGHPHFSSPTVTIVDAKDWADGDTNPEAPSPCDHGVHVAGTIAGNGSVGVIDPVTVTGVAPDADLVVSRVFAVNSTTGDCDDWATKWGGPQRKFNKVRDKGAKIISNSWGHDSGGDYDIEASKTDTWAKKHPNTVVVFSNGNNNRTIPNEFDGSPALAKNVISVGAVRDGSRVTGAGSITGSSRLRANTDSYLNGLNPTVDIGCGSERKKPELYAPGHWTTAPVTGGGYDEKLGTSMAAPHVAGVAALFREKYPGSRATAVRANLVSTAAPPELQGYGVVNANNALFTNPYESVHGHVGDKVKKGKKEDEDFYVPENAEKVVVTLAWNDPGHTPSPGTGISCGAKGSGILANDLDLLAGPSGDVNRYTNRNDNNVKRIVVDDPDSGTWTARVRGHRVSFRLFEENSQKYDLVYRVVTDDPTLSVNESSQPFSNRIEIEPWESDRDESFSVDINGTGAPVSGITADARIPGDLRTCDDWEPATVVGTLSDGHTYRENACATVPFPETTTQNYTVEYVVNTTNAEGLSGPNGRNTTQEVVFEVRPKPDNDRWERGGRNDALADAVPISDDSWDHVHLRCYGDSAFSGGSTNGNCSSVLTDPSFSADPDEPGGAVTAYERWDLTIGELSINHSRDEDFFNVTIPDTDTPTLPEPECGTQNVTIGGETKEVKTSGSLRIAVVSTANSLGDDGVRTAGPATPINVYDDTGTKVTTGSTTGSARQVTRRIPCPHSNGLTDISLSFGEGVHRNMGTYRIEISYGIDITRPNDAASINREQALDAYQAERLERYIVAGELIGGECAGLDCSIVKGHPTGPEVGEDPVCRRAICRDPTFVTIGGSGTFRLSAVGHPDLRFELQDPTGEPIAASETTETFTAAGFERLLTDLGYAQWVNTLGTEQLVGLLNQPAPGSGDALALNTTDAGTTVAARQQLTVEDLQPGTYRLVVEGPPGNYWLTEFDRPPVPDEEPEGPTVRLAPASQSVAIDRTTTVDVALTDVDGGVGSYELLVNTSDAATARIVDAENRIGGTDRIEVAEDGSGVRLGAFAGDTDDTGTVTVATVTLAGVEPGTAGLSVDARSVSDEAGAQYDVAVGDLATVTVQQEPDAPEVVPGRPANDLDGDRVYEDVNGDNDVTPGDASVLFNAIFEGNEAVTANPERFDLNGDGSVTAGDATVLFDEAFGG